MKKLLFVIILFVFCLPELALASGDLFQFRQQTGVSKKYSDFKVFFNEEIRFRDRSKSFFQHFSEIGLSYKGLHENLTLTGIYRYSKSRKSSEWTRESRPYLMLEYKDKVSDFKWANRFRLEYQDKETSSDIWRYRNKLQLSAKPLESSWDTTPYLYDEVFFRLNDGGYERNRIGAGLSAMPKDFLKLDLYYIWDKERDSSGGDQINIVGLKVNFIF